ncbi:MAG: hypothetical protein OXC91_04440 [Rhodobacteraceae bacterium]|nr:hypothetical protein [Paracoccaceae bacterium]
MSNKSKVSGHIDRHAPDHKRHMDHVPADFLTHQGQFASHPSAQFGLRSRGGFIELSLAGARAMATV